MGTPKDLNGHPLRSLQWANSGDGMNTGPVPDLEPLSTVLSGNWGTYSTPRLYRPTLFLGDPAQKTLPRSTLFLGANCS